VLTFLSMAAYGRQVTSGVLRLIGVGHLRRRRERM